MIYYTTAAAKTCSTATICFMNVIKSFSQGSTRFDCDDKEDINAQGAKEYPALINHL